MPKFPVWLQTSMENLLASEWSVTLLGINYLAYIIYLLRRNWDFTEK